MILYLIWLNIPKYFISDLQSSFTWSFQFKVSSKVSPRYLKDFTRVIFINSVLISFKCWGIGLLIVWKSTKFVFSSLIFSLLLMHHLTRPSNFDIMLAIRTVKSGWDINNAVSSANSLKYSDPTAWCISFMYNAKNNGPSTEPCGTPHSIFPVDDAESFTTVYWSLLVRYDLKKLFVWPLMPKCSSLCNNISWSTVSKALVKSTKILIKYFPSSRYIVIVSVNSTNARVVEYSLRNPYWYLNKILFISKNFYQFSAQYFFKYFVKTRKETNTNRTVIVWLKFVPLFKES